MCNSRISAVGNYCSSSQPFLLKVMVYWLGFAVPNMVFLFSTVQFKDQNYPHGFRIMRLCWKETIARPQTKMSTETVILISIKLVILFIDF